MYSRPACSTLSGDARMLIFKDQVPYGYFIFLLGSYLMGTSAAFTTSCNQPLYCRL